MENKLTVTINKTELPIKEYNGLRVVTLKEIDAVHERPEGTARKRFNDNRKHFIEDVDYFKISASEFRTRFDPAYSKQATEQVTLITESGYLMLVKSFTDDLAWVVQRQLVNTYFQSSPEQRKAAAMQTSSDEARARLEASTRRADAMLLNAKNRTASILQKLYDRAGIKPEYQAMAFSDFYSTDGVNLSRDAYQDMKQTYDKGAIAEKLGVYSKASGGKTPHAQAIGAIIATLDLSEDERERLPYCNNGHDGVDYQYTESVVEKVWAWLEANNKPSPITVNGKNYAVIYRKDGYRWKSKSPKTSWTR